MLWRDDSFDRLEHSLPDPIPIGVPGTNLDTPSAFGGGWGTVAVGLSYQRRARYILRQDGTASFTAGFGDPNTLIGLDATVAILELQPFGRRGSFAFQLSRVLPSRFAVAAGVENVLNWGGTDFRASSYAVVSKQIRMKKSAWESFSRAYLSAGVGNGRFRPERVQGRRGGVGAFASVGVQVLPPVAAFAEWTGQDLDVGISFSPLRTFGLTVTPTLLDITGNAGDGARFSMAASWSFTLPDTLRRPFSTPISGGRP
jgi:hypothetical protein